MVKNEETSQVQRKVFNVMVECLQNISKHADPMSGQEDEERRGIVLVSHGETSYNVITGNVIKAEKRAALEATLQHINSLDKEGLSALYKQQILGGKISEKGGAGLGFIDIAKKSGNKIESLKAQDAKINSWGVGTRLITSNDNPAFGGVYKLAAVKNPETGEFVPKIKLSENSEKVTNPGNKKIYRVYEKETGKIKADLICLVDESFSEDEPLLLFDPSEPLRDF